ncbi:MAG TPA: DUF3047 domain-containing protein [Sphingomicrobium sp.]|nr:DUF3047 domain-containing protein [Sphingomicrobium sp.]
MLSILLAAYLMPEPVWVGRFTGSGEPPAPWRVVPIGKAKPTRYRVTNVAKIPAIEARVDSSMALLGRPIKVDLAETPMLCWRWLIQGVVAKGDIRKKGGNDFAARVYVAFDMPDSALSVMTQMKLAMARRMLGLPVPDAAITYVWDNRSPVGFAARSPFTDRQQLIVAQSGNDRAGEWVSQRVDVAADFARAFAGKPGRPFELAIAADGDNTRSTGRAAFADIHFVRRDERCAV